MLSRTALAAGAAGVAALGLIGGGSYAAFSTNAIVTQSISSGTLEVTLTNLNNTSEIANATGGSNGTLTLPAESNLSPGQSFTDVVQIKNTGSVPAQLNSATYDVGTLANSADVALASNLSASVALTSSSVSGLPGTFGPIGPGGVTSGQSGTISFSGDKIILQPGQWINATITVTFSASAGNDAQGGTVTPTLSTAVTSAS